MGVRGSQRERRRLAGVGFSLGLEGKRRVQAGGGWEGRHTGALATPRRCHS